MTMTEMPTLTGSPKQVAWATDIRSALRLSLDAYNSGRRAPEWGIITATVTAHAATITTANWWITAQRQTIGPIAGPRLTSMVISSMSLDERQALKAACAAAVEAAARPRTAPELIATLRSAGRSVREIAAACGVHTSTVYRWAKGAFRPQSARLAALAAL